MDAPTADAASRRTQAALADLRKTYDADSLDEQQASPDPFEQFGRWLDAALAHPQVLEPNAMTLATVGADLRPSLRVVLIKGFDARGIVWYTNYDSRKGRELAGNPFAALAFHWVALERQVRIEGRVERTGDDESDAYFASRPLAHRIGAWASEQSREIDGKATLVARAAEYGLKFGLHPPRPPHWGGYRLVPDAFEFWQGRPSRLHDRLRYERPASSPAAAGATGPAINSGEGWRRVRLAP